ncbi:MotA/TolQ/ExbB proton channel family protein [Tautonia sociabilis]|uniref:MotA/TolQ/ExbB proton channel family protein n=1 Tax=Tautonia sociabilis TaxID=2080755 RepID=A0A432MFS8_9BACT|nr:MotA/TolQ/ExbB proton channel family protein [Tautonia sociabilis]RUL85257.1 MotA/TolQ/ExbB proton channel family protein [Tautonia sociabilis]
MDISLLLKLLGYGIYVAQALLAIWGTYNAVMVYRGIGKRTLDDAHAAQLLEQVAALVGKTGQVREAVDLCNRPPYWHTTLAQLVGVGLENLHKGLAKIKQLLVMEFHTQVISAMENRLASVVTAAKLAPLLGLLGTVIGMIGAFGNVGAGQRATDPGSQLAASIALGLWTTAVGLIIASPLMLLANDLQGRLRKLRDTTERQLQGFLDFLEAEETRRTSGRASSPRPGSGTVRAVLPR